MKEQIAQGVYGGVMHEVAETQGLPGIEETCRHFGYPNVRAIGATTHAYWPKEELFKLLEVVPKLIHSRGMEKEKFRIVLDYDPEFPRMVFQLHVNEDRTTPKDLPHITLADFYQMIGTTGGNNRIG